MIATIRMTPITGDTASSFFLVNAIILTPIICPILDTTMYNLIIPYFGIYMFVFKEGKLQDMYCETCLNWRIKSANPDFFKCLP